MTDSDTTRGPGLAGMAPLKVIAAFDLGSNSIKMTVARLTSAGTVEEFLWRAETTRLGAGIDQTGRLATDRIAATTSAVAELVAEARTYGATRFIAVATEAIRVAENSDVLLDHLHDEFDLHIETISGEREAELTFAGLDRSIDRSGHLLVADIGGASTELIQAVEGAVEKSASLSLGSGRLTDRFVNDDPPSMTELTAVRDHARAAISALGWLVTCDRLVITGGTAEYSRRLLDHDWPAGSAELESVLERATTVQSADLASLIDAPVLRARVLPAGIAIAAALADLAKPGQILGAASGIRSGLLQAAFQADL